MREKKIKGQLKKLEAIKHPHLPHPMIHNNNTMDIDILVQMTPSNKCGRQGMMKYSTYTWDLVRVLESPSPASYKTSGKFIDSIHANN